MIEIVRDCASPGAVHAMARGLAAVAQAGDRIGLRGELGAGKTFFVRAFAAALGADPSLVSSPTFVVVNQYPGALHSGGAVEIVHADFYRLCGEADLDALGWDRFANAIVAAEWHDRVPGALGSPESFGEVELVATGEESRRLVLRLPESWRDRAGVSGLIAHPPSVCKVSGRDVAPTDKTYPFADERSRLADLNRWFTGAHRVTRDATPEDLGES
jgi:tRNA threonylcarbamoyladenosine biosynthesis protein TsaE